MTAARAASALAFTANRVEPIIVYLASGASGSFVQRDNTSVRYKGVCGGVRKAYYPHGPQVLRASAAAAARVPKPDRKRGGPSGIELGKLVDTQLGAAVAHMRRTSIGVVEYLTTAASLAPGARGTVDVHTRTRALLQYMHARQWHPIACQVPVCCTASRRATMVDAVCVDLTNGGLVLVEVKSGYAGGYAEGKSALQPPFAHVLDSNRNRHQLQHMLTTLLFRHTYNVSATDAVHSAVVRIDDTHVTHYPLEAWVLAGEADMRRRFLSAGRRKRAAAAPPRAPKAPAKRRASRKHAGGAPRAKAKVKAKRAKRGAAAAAPVWRPPVPRA